ncbi:hypothetical protein H4R18_000730 [Coemansia javaensis]|uniref:Protein kinase domain-containing protein n=1 Tax=Coemansia javaensis TaxID=2761396 RepID=A0A9W8LLB8_9FUNG|nr:hypothetical protein H4R18_000730 [Coemansia javaensis]
MGNAIAKQAAEEGLGLHKFRLLRVIGRGSFGKVRIVEHRATGRRYALKYIGKAACISNRSHTNALRERDMLEEIEHPYVVNLRFSFQDEYTMFMVMDLMGGGDLRFHIMRRRFFEGVIRFWIAELACALHHLHSVHGIVHRDVKPDNILMDHEGHVALTDFNIATKIVGDQPHYAVAGTANYMAPEVVSGVGYTYSVDWWSLGVVMYECVYGRRPFRHKKNTDDLKRALLYEEIQFPIVADVQVTYDCISAMRAFLNKDPHLRLGCGASGYADIKAHPFFASLDWDRIEARQLSPPFVPAADLSNFDISHDLEEMLLEPEPLADSGGRGRHHRAGGKRARAPAEHASPEYRALSDSFATFDYIEYEQFRAYLEVHGSISALAIEDARSEAAAVRPSGATLCPPPLSQMRLDDRPIINLDAQSTLSYSVTMARGHGVIQQQQPVVVSHAQASAVSASPGEGLAGGGGGVSLQAPSLRQRLSDAKRRGSSGAHRGSDSGRAPPARGAGSLSTCSSATTIPAAAYAAAEPRLAMQQQQQQQQQPVAMVPGTLEPPAIVPIDILAWNQLLPAQRALAYRYCVKMARERRRRLPPADPRAAAPVQRPRGSNMHEFPRLAARSRAADHAPQSGSYTPPPPPLLLQSQSQSHSRPAKQSAASQGLARRRGSSDLLGAAADMRIAALRRQLSADSLAAPAAIMSLDMHVDATAAAAATADASRAPTTHRPSDGDDEDHCFYRNQPLPPPPPPIADHVPLAGNSCLAHMSLADAPTGPLPPPPPPPQSAYPQPRTLL